jgi:hypothetical protein
MRRPKFDDGLPIPSLDEVFQELGGSDQVTWNLPARWAPEWEPVSTRSAHGKVADVLRRSSCSVGSLAIILGLDPAEIANCFRKLYHCGYGFTTDARGRVSLLAPTPPEQ